MSADWGIVSSVHASTMGMIMLNLHDATSLSLGFIRGCIPGQDDGEPSGVSALPLLHVRTSKAELGPTLFSKFQQIRRVTLHIIL